MMLELTPLVEPLSIDEAFLDLSGTERAAPARRPAAALARFARRVEDEIGITVSVGLSYNKFLAKIASDLDKPRGFAVIGRGEARGFLADKPVGDHAGRRRGGAGAAGQATASRRCATCAKRAPRISPGSSGEDGRAAGAPRARRGRAAASRPERETKSVSAETTFETDLRAFEALRPILWRLCERVSRPPQGAQALPARSVTLKLKIGEFRLRTRTRSGLPADAAGRPPVRSGRTAAARSMRRHRLPPDRHRRDGPVRCGGSRPRRPRGPEGAPRGQSARPPSTGFAKSSGRRRCRRASRSARLNADRVSN